MKPVKDGNTDSPEETFLNFKQHLKILLFQ